MSDKYPGGFVTAGAPAGFSVALNGSSDYLTWTGSSIATSQFSFECWFYCTGNIASDKTLLGIANTTGLNVRIPSATTISLDNYGVAAYTFTVPTMSANTWYHVAAVRGASNVCTIFLNGVRSSTGTQTLADNFGSSSSIGYLNSASNLFFTGYISNARLIVGSTPYDPTATTINVPTQLFPTTDTKLLTCQSPTIIDNSNSPFTITAVSGAKVSNFTPFAGYTGFNPALGAAAGGVWTLDESAYYQQNRLWPIYDPYFNQTTLMLHGNGTNAAQNNTFLDSSTNNFTITRNGNTTQGTFTPFSQTGWSNFFNGTTDYLSNTSLTNFLFTSNLSTMFATFEAWVYPTSWNGNSGYTHNPLWGNNGTYATFGFYNGALQFTRGASQTITATGSVSLNTWSHVAVTINQSTVTFYINGVNAGTGTLTGALGSRGTDFIGHQNGGGGSSYFAGYISNFRISTNVVYTSNFTPSTVPLIATTGTQTLTCQDNRFVDDSANNFALTVNGTPSVQAFSPFVPAYITPTTYSNWFDGNSDFLTIAGTSTACALPGDFTIECWLNNAVTTLYGTLFSTVADVSTANGLRISTGNSNNTFQVASALSGLINSSTAFSNNTWVHVALVRSGTTLTLYQNGISVGSATNSQSFVSDTFYIGNLTGTGSPYYLNGVVSNFRVVKGTALYTAAFTPPTAPLTAITNTSLLTCQSSTFIDNSTNNFTITANGNVQPVTSPTPFPAKVDTTTLNSAYSTSLIGGSAYFDGRGDYLNTTSSSNLAFGTGDFTVDFWIYATSLPASDNNILNQNLANGTPQFYIDSSGKLQYRNAFVGAILTSNTTFKAGQWYYCVIARSSGTSRMFINGALDTSGADTTNWSNTAGWYVSNNSGPFTGYMAGSRLIKGTALYTQNFAPPITPPTAVTNTQLLLNYTNGAIFDNTAKNVLETVGNAQISTTQSKWGGTSMYFDGTNDWVRTASNPDLALGTGNFTVECWVYTGVTGTRSGVVGNRTSTGGDTVWCIDLNPTNVGSFGYIYFHTDNSAIVNSGSTNFPVNTWFHVAVTRINTTFLMFINGVQVGTGTSSINLSSTVPMYVGAEGSRTDQSNSLNGYIADLRITKGVARYVANFTPPTSQLQDQ